jgi:hypothetical protein
MIAVSGTVFPSTDRSPAQKSSERNSFRKCPSKPAGKTSRSSHKLSPFNPHVRSRTASESSEISTNYHIIVPNYSRQIYLPTRNLTRYLRWFRWVNSAFRVACSSSFGPAWCLFYYYKVGWFPRRGSVAGRGFVVWLRDVVLSRKASR